MKQYTTKNIEGKLLLIATILASGMAFLDGTVVNIAIPTLQNKLNASLSEIQWVINGYALMLCSLILIAGSLGDRFGRKRIFMYGIGLFIFSSFLCSISTSITELAFFRALQGIGGAMMVPGSLSIIDSSFKKDFRGRAIGIWSGFAGGVAALGPFLGGYLVQYFNWPSIFYINIPLGIIALILAYKYIPESRNLESTKIDLIGSILIFLSLLGLTYGLISGSDLGWSNPFILVSLTLGLILFITFIFWQTREKEPLVPLSIFKSPLVTGANLATLFLYFALSGVVFFLVLNLQQIQGYTPLEAGFATLPSILLITFLSGYGGTLADKIGPRFPMIVGPFIVSIGMFLLTLVGLNVNYFTQILPGLILFGLGMSIVIAPLTKSALAVDEKYSGAASGVNNAVARIAGLFAVALLGAIALSLFENSLKTQILNSSLNINTKQIILSQANKLGGINIPKNLNMENKMIAKEIIDRSFINSYKWAMGINAALAFLSSVISFFTINNRKR